MNKLLITTAAVAVLGFAGTAAMASEATEFAIPASTLTRGQAAAVAAMATDRLPSRVVANHEATQFADHGQSADRAAVREEGRMALRQNKLAALYVGA